MGGPVWVEDVGGGPVGGVRADGCCEGGEGEEGAGCTEGHLDKIGGACF